MLQLNIDKSVNPWAYNLDLPNKQEYLNNLLDIGYRMSTLMKVNSRDPHTEQLLELQQQKNETCMNMTLRHLEESMTNVATKMDQIEQRASDNTVVVQDKLVKMVEDFTGKTKTSVSRGDIAENYIEKICETEFPNDTVIRSSGTAHEADLQLRGDDFPNIMIESKNYTSTIQLKEIDKFKYDMTRTNTNYGVFFSFNSKISGKKNMDIEQFNDNKYILYISDIGFNQDIIVMAINMLKTLSKISSVDNTYINKSVVKDKISTIIYNLNKLPELIRILSKTRTTLIEEERSIRTSMDNIHMAYITTESAMKQIIQDIERDIHSQLGEFNDIEYIQVENIDELLINMDDKKKEQVRAILTQIYSNKYMVSISELNPHIYNIYRPSTGKLVSKLDTKPAKLKLSIPDSSCIFEINKKNSISNLKTYFQILENI